MPHPATRLSKAVIAGVFSTRQARALGPEWTSRRLVLDAGTGALADAGLAWDDVDGLIISGGMGEFGAGEFAYEMGMGPVWTGAGTGIAAVLQAAGAIELGLCRTVLIAGGQANSYTDRSATAPWTRPTSEFVACWGLFTAAEFALIARRHMAMYGTRVEHLAKVSATIRNNGHVNPDAVYYGRGPFTVEDILASRMIADPFHLLDCSMTAEGGAAIVITHADRRRDLRSSPVHLLGGGMEAFGPPYRHPPAFDLAGWLGRSGARRAFGYAGITPDDIGTCEFYDPFSFEVIRQFEAYGFCGEGDGGPYVMSGVIEPGGKHPICTDGGLMSYSHAGSIQLIQKVIQSARQVRGDAPNQLPGTRISMCGNSGAGALFHDFLIVGDDRP